jgi:hypothetical protein
VLDGTLDGIELDGTILEDAEPGINAVLDGTNVLDPAGGCSVPWFFVASIIKR